MQVKKKFARPVGCYFVRPIFVFRGSDIYIGRNETFFFKKGKNEHLMLSARQDGIFIL